MRDELLNETLFFSLDHARAKIGAWVSDYNHRRPHSSLGYATPAEHAANLNHVRRMSPRSKTWVKLRSTSPPPLRMASLPTSDFKRLRFP
jgi:hypothetical protein